MDESTGKIKIGFSYTDEFGNTWSSESEESLYAEFEGTLDIIAHQFDAFLRQVGFARRGDTMFIDSITEEEWEVLKTALEDYRNKTINGGIR